MKTWRASIGRISRSAFAVVAGVIFIGLCALRWQIGQADRNVPFTAEYVRKSSNLVRGTTLEMEMFYAVRSDGVKSEGLRGIFPRRRTVTNVTEKRKVELSDAYRLKTTYDYQPFPFTVRRLKYGPRCSPPDSSYTYVGEDSILGYRAYHYLGPAYQEEHGSEETHYWYSPDLNCFMIQAVAYKRDRTGKTTVKFERKMGRIKLGEPDEDLFAVPDDYREVTPSEFEKTLLYGMVQEREGYEGVRRFAIPPGTQRYFATLDENYELVRRGPSGAGPK